MVTRPHRRSSLARRAALVLALATTPALFAGPSSAEPTREDRAAATALFDEGRKLAADRKFAEACPKFEAAMRLDPGMGTLYNLSDCYEQIGRTASAWSGFREVAAQAKAANQPEREKAARERAAALEPKLTKLRIVIAPEMAGQPIDITRDGSAVPSALAGTAIPVDPGSHTIRVTAAGKEPFETTVTIGAGKAITDVSIPALAPKKGDGAAGAPTAGSPTAGSPTAGGAPSPTGPLADSAPTATPTSSATQGPADASPRPWQKPLGITATIVGALGVGAGMAVFFGGALPSFEKSNQNGLCTNDVCNAEGLALRSDAVTLGDVATIVGIASGVVGAAGLVLWITAPSAPSSPAKAGSAGPGVRVSTPLFGDRPASVQGATLQVGVGAGPGGVALRGQF